MTQTLNKTIVNVFGIIIIIFYGYILISSLPSLFEITETISGLVQLSTELPAHIKEAISISGMPTEPLKAKMQNELLLSWLLQAVYVCFGIISGIMLLIRNKLTLKFVSFFFIAVFAKRIWNYWFHSETIFFLIRKKPILIIQNEIIPSIIAVIAIVLLLSRNFPFRQKSIKT